MPLLWIFVPGPSSAVPWYGVTRNPATPIRGIAITAGAVFGLAALARPSPVFCFEG